MLQVDQNYRTLELALDFPELDEDQYAALRDDIKEHGLRQPIVLSQSGRIIDGRNRYKALREIYEEYKQNLGGSEFAKAVEALRFRTVTYDEKEKGDSEEYVLSANLARRHLSPSQRCMIVARARLGPENAKKRKVTNVSELARRYSLQRATLYKAEYVLKYYKVAASQARAKKAKQEFLRLPELVTSGNMSIGIAEQQIANVIGQGKAAGLAKIDDLQSLARRVGAKIRFLSKKEDLLREIAPLLIKLDQAIDRKSNDEKSEVKSPTEHD